MAKNILIPYRGDLVNARLGFKAQKKKNLRKFKRDLIKLWDLSGPAALWGVDEGYINDKLRKLLGIEKNFMPEDSGLYYFGVELKPSADVDKILALSDNQKDFLRQKCVAIFNKYGHTVQTKYKDGGFEFRTFLADGTETEFEGAEDEELASILYDRVVMYMVSNDSSDTVDNWSEHYEEEDFFNNDIRSKLTSFKYTFTSSDILKVINDRLFTKRSYRTIGGTGFFKKTVTANGIDMVLFNELLDNGTSDNVDGRYWTWNGSGYVLKVDDVKDLPEDEFMIFIQTHLGTFQVAPKKKWYQKGIWGVIFIIIIVVVAVALGQPELLGYIATIGLGATLVIAGMVISITGAFIGNKVMVTGGQIVSLVGGGISIAESIMAEQAVMQTYTQQMMNAGVDQVAMQQAINVMADEFLINTALGIGKFALNIYSSADGILGNKNEEGIKEGTLPAEKINEIYVADDISWDFVQRFLPDFIIASNLKVM